MLYRSTDCRSRCGAAVENLAHSASFHSREKTAPSKSGIKHLASYMDDCSSTWNTRRIQGEQHVVARHRDARIARHVEHEAAIDVASHRQRYSPLIGVNPVGRRAEPNTFDGGEQRQW